MQSVLPRQFADADIFLHVCQCSCGLLSVQLRDDVQMLMHSCMLCYVSIAAGVTRACGIAHTT